MSPQDEQPRPAEPVADADPPTESVAESGVASTDGRPATAEPGDATSVAGEPVAEPGDATTVAGEHAADTGAPSQEPVADADPPSELVAESGDASTDGRLAAAEPGDATTVSGEPAADTGTPTQVADAAPDEPTVEPVADADPPTELVAEPGDAPADVPPATAQPDDATTVTGEPLEGTASPAQAADADPPTEVLDPPPDTEELPELTDAELESTLEALLLVVDSPVDEESLADATDTTVARVSAALLRMVAQYDEHERGLDLRHAGGGWRYYTRDRYAPYVEKLLLGGQRAKLTRAALETLAVIAYRQPVTRARVAAVRGVNCDGVIRTLLARGLVEETGTDLETGGFLYRTTELFLERLGLSSLEDLPPIAPLLPEVDSIDDI